MKHCSLSYASSTVTAIGGRDRLYLIGLHESVEAENCEKIMGVERE